MRTLLVVSMVLLGVQPSWAALGEPLDSVAQDQQKLHGQLRSSAGDGYSVHEITAENGTVVRQFASPSGMVFGVSWRGPFLPDLSQLLGPYFLEYQRAARPTVRRHGPTVVRTDRLVVETGGHVRALRGRAWVPGLMPPAVTEQVVR